MADATRGAPTPPASDAAAAASTDGIGRSPLTRSPSYRPCRSATPSNEVHRTATGTALPLRIAQRAVCRQRQTAAAAAAVVAADTGQPFHPRHDHHHRHADQDSRSDGGGNAVVPTAAAAAAAGGAAAGGLRLRPYRFFPATPMAATSAVDPEGPLSYMRPGRRCPVPPTIPTLATSAPVPAAGETLSSGPAATHGSPSSLTVGAAPSARHGSGGGGGSMESVATCLPQGPATPTAAGAATAAIDAAEAPLAGLGVQALPAAPPAAEAKAVLTAAERRGGAIKVDAEVEVEVEADAEPSEVVAVEFTEADSGFSSSSLSDGDYRTVSGSSSNSSSSGISSSCSRGRGGDDAPCCRRGLAAAKADPWVGYCSAQEKLQDSSRISNGRVSSGSGRGDDGGADTSQVDPAARGDAPDDGSGSFCNEIGDAASGGFEGDADGAEVHVEVEWPRGASDKVAGALTAVAGKKCSSRSDSGSTDNWKNVSAKARIIVSSSSSRESEGGCGSSRPPPPQLAVLQPLDPPVPRPPPFVRYYPDGRHPSYRLPLPYRLLAQATLMTYIGWPYVLLALAVVALCGCTAAIVVLAALAATLALPAPPRPWEALLTSRLFRLWRAYFNFSLLYEEMIDLTRPHVFAMSPHGAFPLSQLLGGSLGHQLWPGHPIHCLAASCLFYVPLWRHIKAWLGAAPADRATAKQLLMTQGSVAVLPGGIAEMFVQAASGGRNCERVKLQGRRGFVRLALETGAPIVPVYHFGNSQVLSFGPPALQPLSRRIRVAVGTIMGLWGLPIPRPQPLLMAIGRPIYVPYTHHREPHFERLVEETWQRVLVSYREMYERYGKEYGWGDRPLEVC